MDFLKSQEGRSPRESSDIRRQVRTCLITIRLLQFFDLFKKSSTLKGLLITASAILNILSSSSLERFSRSSKVSPRGLPERISTLTDF